MKKAIVYIRVSKTRDGLITQDTQFKNLNNIANYKIFTY